MSESIRNSTRRPENVPGRAPRAKVTSSAGRRSRRAASGRVPIRLTPSRAPAPSGRRLANIPPTLGRRAALDSRPVAVLRSSPPPGTGPFVNRLALDPTLFSPRRRGPYQVPHRRSTRLECFSANPGIFLGGPQRRPAVPSRDTRRPASHRRQAPTASKSRLPDPRPISKKCRKNYPEGSHRLLAKKRDDFK